MRSQMALMAIAINLAAGFSVQDNCGPEANIEFVLPSNIHR